jgi:hypothetical protein
MEENRYKIHLKKDQEKKARKTPAIWFHVRKPDWHERQMLKDKNIKLVLVSLGMDLAKRYFKGEISEYAIYRHLRVYSSEIKTPVVDIIGNMPLKLRMEFAKQPWGPENSEEHWDKPSIWSSAYLICDNALDERLAQLDNNPEMEDYYIDADVFIGSRKTFRSTQMTEVHTVS